MCNCWRCLIISAKERGMQINDDIKVKEVRLIGPEGEALGIMGIDEARNYAYDQGLDIVLIAPKATPPVCRVMDYGKYRFEKEKREKEAKKRQQITQVKEIQLSCRIDTHDFNTRVNHAHRFLASGDKVKVTLRFKGREMAHIDIGREIIERFEKACADIGVADKRPKLEGRFMSMVLSPLKQPNK